MHQQEQDLLYICFEKHLHHYVDEDECVEEFTLRVIEEIASIVLQQGHIPTQYLQEIHQELEEEIVEMLQKKIYGHWDIGHYRRAMGNQSA